MHHNLPFSNKLTNSLLIDPFLSDSLLNSLFLQENIILAYDTADDGEDAVLDYSDSEASELLTAEGDADYPDVQIDWSAWISSMPSPVLLD